VVGDSVNLFSGRTKFEMPHLGFRILWALDIGGAFDIDLA